MNPPALAARLALLAGAALVPLLMARQGRDLKQTAAVVFALAATAAATGAGLRGRAPALRPALVPFAAWGACLAGPAVALGPAVAGALLPQLAFLAFGLVAAAVGSRADVRRLVALWGLTFLAVGGYALLQRAGLDPVEEFRRWHSRDRVFATFGNASFLGTHAAFLLPLWIGAFAAARPPLVRAAALTMAAFTAVVLYFTFSRGAWLGGFTGTATTLAFFRPRRASRRLAAPALLVVAATIVLLIVPREHLIRRTDRLELWRGTLTMLATSPLIGWGPGSFPSEFPPFAPARFAARMARDNTFAEHPHCEYLHVAVESGLPALGVFLWAITALLRAAAARARSGGVTAGVLGALAAVLVHAAVDRNFRLASTAVPFWLLAGAVAVPWGPALPSSRRPPPSALLLVAVAALTAGSWALRPFHASLRVAAERDFLELRGELSLARLRALAARQQGNPDFHVRLGIALARGRRFEEAADSFRRALILEPGMVSAANNLGNSYFMLSRFDDAIAAYRRVLETDPGHLDARFNMAYALFHQRRIKEALRECDEVLRRAPSHAKARQLKGQISP